MMKARLLLADNDHQYRESLHRVLVNAGYDVVDAYDPEEATCRLHDRGRFDVVLIDVRLRNDNRDDDTSGLKVGREARDRHMPWIVITAHDSETARIKAWETGPDSGGAAAYYCKKETPEELVQKIERLRGSSLLHVSDLHLHSDTAYENPYNQDRSLKSIYDDIEQLEVIRFHPPVAIVVSGDIAWRCEPKTFDRASEFLQELATKLHVARKNVVLTPGNHDIDRSRGLTDTDSRIARKNHNPDWFRKFESYLHFTRRFYDEPAFTEAAPYRIFYISDDIAIVSFVSSLLEGDSAAACNACPEDEKHYPGWINRDDIDRAAAEIQAKQPRGLRVAVWHHNAPPEPSVSSSSTESDRRSVTLTESAVSTPRCIGRSLQNYHGRGAVKQVLSQNGFGLLLTGHSHKESVSQPTSLSGGGPVQFTAGTIWTDDLDGVVAAHYSLFAIGPWRRETRAVMRRYEPATEQRPGQWVTDTLLTPNGVVYLPERIWVPQ